MGICLVIAGGLEVFWSTCMKVSNGFTEIKFTILTDSGNDIAVSFSCHRRRRHCRWELPRRMDRNRSAGSRDRRYCAL